MPEEKNVKRIHNVLIYGRKKAELSGIENVISFDENSVVLETCEGILSIDGSDLNISKLDTANGEVFLEGTIDSVFYPSDEKKESKGIFKRIFS